MTGPITQRTIDRVVALEIAGMDDNEYTEKVEHLRDQGKEGMAKTSALNVRDVVFLCVIKDLAGIGFGYAAAARKFAEQITAKVSIKIGELNGNFGSKLSEDARNHDRYMIFYSEDNEFVGSIESPYQACSHDSRHRVHLVYDCHGLADRINQKLWDKRILP